MRRRPPRSTRTDTLFPYTTLFRSAVDLAVEQRERRTEADPRIRLRGFENAAGVINPPCRAAMGRWQREALTEGPCRGPSTTRYAGGPPPHAFRSVERRVGKACVSQRLSRGAKSHYKKKIENS